MKRLSNKDLATATAASEAALRDAIARLGYRFNPARPAPMPVPARAAMPVAAALLGAGLAWFALGRRKAGMVDEPDAEDLMDWEDEGGLPVEAGEIEPDGLDWLTRAMAARERAELRLAGLYEAGKITATEKAEAAVALAEDLADAFRDGLSDLEDEAVERVAEARAKAWEALGQGKALAAKGLAKSQAAAQSHPVAASALGLAVAAGVAAAFPKTRPVIKTAVPVAAAAVLARTAAILARERKAGAKLRKQAASAEEMIDDMADAIEKKARSTKRRAKSAASSAVSQAKKKASTKRMNGAAVN